MSDKPETKQTVLYPKLCEYEIAALLASKNMSDWTGTVGTIMERRKDHLPPDWEDVVIKGEMWKKLPWCNGKSVTVNTMSGDPEKVWLNNQTSFEDTGNPVAPFTDVNKPTSTAASTAHNPLSHTCVAGGHIAPVFATGGGVCENLNLTFNPDGTVSKSKAKKVALFSWNNPHKSKQIDPETPEHYAKHPSGIECITIAEGFNFNLGNVIKYVWRAGLKVGVIEDLKKARDYINFEIERIERYK